MRKAIAKASCGSYKDYVPNHYALGYQLTSYMRSKYDNMHVSRIVDRAASLSFWPYSFSGSTKKYTGKRIPAVYNEAYEYLKSSWKSQLDSMSETRVELLDSTKYNYYVNFEYPQQTETGEIVAVMSGLDTPRRLVLISKDGTVKKLAQVDATEKISYANGLVAWESSRTHARWGEKSWSEIMIYDLRKRSRHRLTKHSRYFAPQLSPDGSKVAVVEFTTKLNSQILILDTQTGNVLEQLPNPANDVLRQPSWNAKGDKLVYTSGKNNLIALKIFNLKTQRDSLVLPYSTEGINVPVFVADKIFFNSSITGIDAIHALDLQTGQRTVAVKRAYGAFNVTPSIDGESVYFQDYTAEGHRIVKTKMEYLKNSNSLDTVFNGFRTYTKLVEQEAGNIFKDSIPQFDYKVSKYWQLKNLINVHSWGFLFADPIYQFLIYSDNKLNTLNLAAGYEHNGNEKAGNSFFRAAYSKFFPVINYVGRYGTRSVYSSSRDEYDTWEEHSSALGLSIPLDLSRSVYSSSLLLEGSMLWTKIRNKEVYEYFDINDGKFYHYNYKLSYNIFKNGSRRDINPRLGFSGVFAYDNTLGESDHKSELKSANFNLYLPGFFKHNSFRIQLAFERNNIDNYIFPSYIDFARGYKATYWDNSDKVSFNYAFTITEPDLDIFRLLYIKRFHANLFYDESACYMDSFGSERYCSSGAELIFNFHLFNLPVELIAGPRLVYRFNDEQWRMEFVLVGYSF